MKLTALAKKLRGLPEAVVKGMLDEAAEALTDLAMRTFEAGETPDGVAWKPGAKGQRVTLQQTGELASQIRYVVTGTKLRVMLGVPYAKYQIGKRQVFPRKRLPSSYRATLKELVAKSLKEAVRAP